MKIPTTNNTSPGLIDENLHSLYRVHYKDHSGDTWNVIVLAASEEKAQELVSEEDDCKRVVCVDRTGL